MLSSFIRSSLDQSNVQSSKSRLGSRTQKSLLVFCRRRLERGPQQEKGKMHVLNITKQLKDDIETNQNQLLIFVRNHQVSFPIFQQHLSARQPSAEKPIATRHVFKGNSLSQRCEDRFRENFRKLFRAFFCKLQVFNQGSGPIQRPQTCPLTQFSFSN